MQEILLDAPNLGNVEREYLLKCLDSTLSQQPGLLSPSLKKNLQHIQKAKEQ